MRTLYDKKLGLSIRLLSETELAGHSKLNNPLRGLTTSGLWITCDGYTAMVKPQSRNELIVQLYLEGWTQDDLANRFHITRARVWQVLRVADVLRGHRRKGKVSEKTALIGFYVEPHIKESLQAYAKANGQSLSQLLHSMVKAEIETRSIPLRVKDDRTLPLPLEANG